MDKTTEPKPRAEKKGLIALAAAAVIAIGKAGTFIVAHIALLFKPAVAAEAIEQAAHAAPAMAHVAAEAAPLTDDAAKAVIKSRLVESAAQKVTTPHMTDGERIARSAANVAKHYGKQQSRSKDEDPKAR